MIRTVKKTDTTNCINGMLLSISLLLFIAPLYAATPLVSEKWLSANLHNPDLVVLDLQPNDTYRRYHIPGAVHSDYSDWRSPAGSLPPKVLPKTSQVEQLIGSLGIDNSSHVVLVVTGRSAGEMASATRVYWTFKAMGHDAVSILDGGLLAYANQRGNRLERGTNRRKRTTFTARPRSEYMPDAGTIAAQLGKDTILVDNRSPAEHLGLTSNTKHERPGTLPGAVNLPFNWLTVNGGARFHSVNNLRRIYQAVGVPTNGRQISFCSTGHRASLAWFVTHALLGNDEARLYDGSMAQWAVDPALPMERKILLD